MSAFSKPAARTRLARRSAMLAVLAPLLFAAACAQEQPPPPAPAPVAPAPAPVPAARG
jgi:hypothetical protein